MVNAHAAWPFACSPRGCTRSLFTHICAPPPSSATLPPRRPPVTSSTSAHDSGGDGSGGASGGGRYPASGRAGAVGPGGIAAHRIPSRPLLSDSEAEPFVKGRPVSDVEGEAWGRGVAVGVVESKQPEEAPRVRSPGAGPRTLPPHTAG